MKKIFMSMKKSQENNCTGFFFNKESGLQPYYKRDFGANFFPVNVEEVSK